MCSALCDGADKVRGSRCNAIVEVEVKAHERKRIGWSPAETPCTPSHSNPISLRHATASFGFHSPAHALEG